MAVTVCKKCGHVRYSVRIPTTVVGGLWCWLCHRAVHTDCLAQYHTVISGCRNPDCPVFPPG